MGDGYDPSRKAKVVGAIQWAAVGLSVSAAFWGLTTDYYWLVRDGFAAEIPSPLETALLGFYYLSIAGGLVAGYLWVKRRTASAEQERREHQTRVAFLFVLLAVGVVSFVAEGILSDLLGDRLYTVPYFVLPSALDLLGLVAAYALVYVADGDWTGGGGKTTDGAYRPSRIAGVVGGVQWGITALYLGSVSFAVVLEYLTRTRESISIDLGREFVLTVGVALVAGYVWARRPVDSEATAREIHARRVEYVLTFFTLAFALSLLVTGALAVVPSIGYELTMVWFVAVVGLSLLFAYVAAYVAEFDLLGRLLST
jgi:hypothetical protein